MFLWRYALIALFFFWVKPSWSATRTWAGPIGSPSWTTPGNWSPAIVPVAGDATIFNTPAGITSIQLTADRSVGTMAFNNTSVPNVYSIVGVPTTRVLTFDNLGVDPSLTIDVTNTAVTNFNLVMRIPAGRTLTVTNNGSAALQIQGTITNGGAGTTLTKNGTGTLSLIGSPNTQGATILNAGTLSISLANQLNSPTGSLTFDGAGTGILDTSAAMSLALPIALTNNGTFSVSGGTLSIDSVAGITGAGNLTKQGSSGTLRFNKVNAYTGSTSIQAGTILAAIANCISTSSALSLTNVAGAVFDLNNFGQSVNTLSGGGALGGNITLGSAMLTVNQGSDQTYGGAISGSGQLFKQGAAKLTLTGANTYTGLTTVAAGTLQGNTSSLPGNIDNYATLIWNQTSNNTYSHDITQSMGLGAMQVQGGGMLTTTGSLTQNTIEIVSGGQMALNGTATVTTLTVDSGGYLIGTGTITGNVDVFGTLGAGASIGTLTVTGNYTQESGSTFLVEIIPTTVDRLEVSNTITLGDHVATFSLMPMMGDYPANQQYVVMHGVGGVSGRFIEPITNSLPSFHATLHYTPLPTIFAEGPSLLDDPAITYVILLVNTVTPSNLPVSPTALIAARCFDTIPNNPFSEFFLFMQIPQMNMTLTQMLPSCFGSLDLTQHDLITQVREVGTREMNLFLKSPCGPPKRFRIWADVFIPHAVQHRRHNQMGYYSSALGEALGFDYQVSPNSFFGVFAAYAQDHMRGKGIDIDGWMHNIYGNMYAGGWISAPERIYAQAVVSGSYDHYHTIRSIYFAGEQFDPFTKKPRARFHGCSGLGSFEIGKFWERVSRNQLYGRVDYSFNYRDDFRESNASVLNLNVKSHYSDFIRLELGDAISRCVTLRNTLFDARAAAGGVLEYQINGKNQKASFTTSSCVMSAKGPTLARAFFFWELGAQIHIEKNYLDVIAGNFRGEYGSGFVSHNWSVELKAAF